MDTKICFSFKLIFENDGFFGSEYHMQISTTRLRQLRSQQFRIQIIINAPYVSKFAQELQCNHAASALF